MPRARSAAVSAADASRPRYGPRHPPARVRQRRRRLPRRAPGRGAAFPRIRRPCLGAPQVGSQERVPLRAPRRGAAAGGRGGPFGARVFRRARRGLCGGVPRGVAVRRGYPEGSAEGAGGSGGDGNAGGVRGLQEGAGRRGAGRHRLAALDRGCPVQGRPGDHGSRLEHRGNAKVGWLQLFQGRGRAGAARGLRRLDVSPREGKVPPRDHPPVAHLGPFPVARPERLHPHPRRPRQRCHAIHGPRNCMGPCGRRRGGSRARRAVADSVGALPRQRGKPQPGAGRGPRRGQTDGEAVHGRAQLCGLPGVVHASGRQGALRPDAAREGVQDRHVEEQGAGGAVRKGAGGDARRGRAGLSQVGSLQEVRWMRRSSGLPAMCIRACPCTLNHLLQ